MSKIDREAACLVEQVINGDGWQASYLAREVIRSGFNQKCTTYWRAIGATLRWIARTRQTYDIHKFLGPLLLYRHHLLPSERNDLFELAAKHLPVNLFWGKDGRDISLDVLIDGKMTDAIPAFKKLLLRDESSQQISMHEALLQGRNNQRLMVLLQLLAIQAEEKRLNRRSEAQSA